jgi:hypothetical protein
MNAIERLTQVLDEKDEQIEELQARVAHLEATANKEWTRHTERKVDEAPSLPIPRLEITWRERTYKGGGHECWYAEYCLVYRHSVGTIVSVPLGGAASYGRGAGQPPLWQGTVDLPSRDGTYILDAAHQMNLPAFARYGDMVRDLAAEVRERAQHRQPTSKARS